jgi:phosphopentomutase
VRAGWEDAFPTPRNDRERELNDLYASFVRYWDNNTFDALAHASAREYIREYRPRVLFVGYGEPDEWAHGRRYDLYLRSIHQVDADIAGLWNTMQAMPQYRGSTTFIITADHGRGRGNDWTDHGREVDGAERVWMAIIGPDTPATGVRSNEEVTQSQIAATIAALLGKNFNAAQPAAAPPISGVQRP